MTWLRDLSMFARRLFSYFSDIFQMVMNPRPGRLPRCVELPAQRMMPTRAYDEPLDEWKNRPAYV